MSRLMMQDKTLSAVRIGYVVLVVLLLILSVARIFTTPARLRTRASTISLSMGVKALIFNLYHLLTTHKRSLKRWASLKAYFILDVIDAVAWIVVIFLVAQSSVRAPTSGVGGVLGWVVFVVAMLLLFIAAYLVYTSFILWRASKRIPRVGKQVGMEHRGGSSDESVVMKEQRAAQQC